jgi:hypothetical protein
LHSKNASADWLKIRDKTASATGAKETLVRRLLLPAVGLALAGAASADSGNQTLDDAWWTGPLIAASAATLPQGHALVEPYVLDIKSKDASNYANFDFLYYGLTDWLTIGAIPFAGYVVPKHGNSAAGLGDTELQAQFRLTKYDADSGMPVLSATIRETVPSGKYDRLGDTPAAGMGSGAYITTFGLFGQTYMWMPNGRILRLRLDLFESLPQTSGLSDASVYGTPASFHGKAKLGAQFQEDFAFEYSITRKWVAAMDVIYGVNNAGSVSGQVGSLPLDYGLGSSRPWAFAPALEYNWSGNYGVILGVRYIPQGRDVTASVTPAIGVNMVF